MDYFFAPERYATPDFVLRCYYPGDGQALMEAVTSSYEHLKTFMPWAKFDQSLEESEANARRFRGLWLLNQDFIVGVWSPDETELWGGTGFHLREGPLGRGNAEIGMWIRASQAGKGLGTAVLKGMVDWGFSEWGWQRLSWRCAHTNIASQRTAEKAGLTLEGRLREFTTDGAGNYLDELCYAILKEDGG